MKATNLNLACLIILIFNSSIVWSQITITEIAKKEEIKTYKGPYSLASVGSFQVGNGIAKYSYREINDQRIKEGAFSFSNTSTMESVKVKGNFKAGKRTGIWETITHRGRQFIKQSQPQNNLAALMGGGTYKISGNFINDKREGEWNWIGGNAIDKTVKSSIKSKAFFKKGLIIGQFYYEFNDPEKDDRYRYIKVEGNFDDDGFATGVWNIKWISADDFEFKDIVDFNHGILTSYKRIDQSTGIKKDIVESDFGNIRIPDQNSQYSVVNLYHTTNPIGVSLWGWLGDPTFMEYQILYNDSFNGAARMKVAIHY